MRGTKDKRKQTGTQERVREETMSLIQRPKLVLPKKILVVEVVDDKGGRFVALPIKDTKQQ